jgi:hypothetical protein
LGYGNCRIFTPSGVVGQTATATILSEPNIPHGQSALSATASDLIILAAPALLTLMLPDKTLKESLSSLRKRYKSLYDVIEAEVAAEQLVLNLKKKRALATNKTPINRQLDAKIAKVSKNYSSPTLWNAWCYLKKVNQRALFTNNKLVLEETRKVMKQYFYADNAEKYQEAFNEFILTCDLIDDKKINQLLDKTSVDDFTKTIKSVSKGELLSNYLKLKSFEEMLTATPDLFLGREPAKEPKLVDVEPKEQDKLFNLAVLASSEPEFAQYLKNTSEQWDKNNLFSENLFKELILFFTKPYDRW